MRVLSCLRLLWSILLILVDRSDLGFLLLLDGLNFLLILNLLDFFGLLKLLGAHVASISCRRWTSGILTGFDLSLNSSEWRFHHFFILFDFLLLRCLRLVFLFLTFGVDALFLSLFDAWPHVLVSFVIFRLSSKQVLHISVVIIVVVLRTSRLIYLLIAVVCSFRRLHFIFILIDCFQILVGLMFVYLFLLLDDCILGYVLLDSLSCWRLAFGLFDLCLMILLILVFL